MEALVEMASPTDGDLKPSTPLAVAAEQFVVAKSDAGLAAGSLAEYERVVRRVIVPRIGDLHLAEATPGRLQAFFTAVTKDHGPGTAKTTRSVLSGILGMAVRADALRTNPVAQVAAIRRGTSRASTALQLNTVPTFIRTVVNDPELKRADVGVCAGSSAALIARTPSRPPVLPTDLPLAAALDRERSVLPAAWQNARIAAASDDLDGATPLRADGHVLLVVRCPSADRSFQAVAGARTAYGACGRPAFLPLAEGARVIVTTRGVLPFSAALLVLDAGS